MKEMQKVQKVQVQKVQQLPPVRVELGTLQAVSPASLIEGASEMASTLANVIRAQGLSVRIQGREYVRVEGWTTLATMMGVTAREVSTVEDGGVYTATVELVRLSDGAVISRASAECGSDDEKDRYGKPVWSTRPRYARRSMAQTRATGKACRLAFSWIMSLAGYEPTPAEEMEPVIEVQAKPKPKKITPPQHRLLEARINDLGLDRERVKAWVLKAWGVEHLNELPRDRFDDLHNRLAVWSQALAEEEAREERIAIQEDGK